MAANLTSAKPGVVQLLPLKKGAPVWAHILSFHNFCEYPTHIFGGGAHRSRNLGLIVHQASPPVVPWLVSSSGEWGRFRFLLLLFCCCCWIGDMLFPCVFFFFLGSIG